MVLLAVLGGYACDTPEAPQSSQSPQSQVVHDKAKIPPTTKEDSTKNATAAIEAWLKLLDSGAVRDLLGPNRRLAKTGGSQETMGPANPGDALSVRAVAFQEG